METVKDFFKQINIRISNPLIFSFIISWLVWNWKIVIVLIFYNEKFLNQDGYKSYLDFITKNTDKCYSFWCPIFFAVGYTFAFPFVSTGVKAFQTWIDKRSNDWNLSILKSGKIGIEKYMSLRESLDVRRDFIEKIIEKEGSNLVLLEEANDKINSLEHQLNENKLEHQREIKNYQQQRGILNTELLQGKWKMQTFMNNTVQNEYIVEVKDNYYYIIQNNKPQKVAMIEHYKYIIDSNNRDSNSIFFIKAMLAENGAITSKVVNELKYNYNTKVMEGIENGFTQIKYTPIS